MPSVESVTAVGNEWLGIIVHIFQKHISYPLAVLLVKYAKQKQAKPSKYILTEVYLLVTLQFQFIQYAVPFLKTLCHHTKEDLSNTTSMTNTNLSQ